MEEGGNGTSKKGSYRQTHPNQGKWVLPVSLVGLIALFYAFSQMF